MISSSKKVTARDLITNANTSLYQKMKNATVKLTSGGTFTASGVIVALSVRLSKRTMIVATAAHNVAVFLKSLTKPVQTKIWGCSPKYVTLEEMNDRKDNAINAFIKDVKIKYVAADWTQDVDTPINGTATISRVVLPSWTYDVCLLYADVALQMFPMYSAVRAMSEVDEARDICTPLTYGVKLPVGYSLLQAGYGRTDPKNEMSTGSLNFKISKLEDDGGEATYYSDTTGTNENVLKLKSTSEWTTLPGDSGGPLFAVNTLKNKFSPIGVTLGSDVGDEEQDSAWAKDPYGKHNNAVTSLSRLYESWYAEGGDPAAVLLKKKFSF